ncbi:hypothetical protein OG792_23435 [Micromonospora sp. NBC_01699]|uniref:hypothetical protein n=1 Tax=Micromonospora sp. NBC_01699 TaxID=2975984 RepID=UPI002E2CBCBC|nr:hypothetical protein [Micromonospora sp. NBC_01699]
MLASGRPAGRVPSAQVGECPAVVRHRPSVGGGRSAFPGAIVGAFALFDALAAGSWAVYSALVGYLGGVAFEHDPVKGLLLGLGIALTITIVVELVRYLRRPPARLPAAVPSTGSADPASATTGVRPG